MRLLPMFALLAPLWLPAETGVMRKEFVYKTTPQGELKIHFFLPDGWKASDHRPVIVFFFGGGWANGTPNQFFTKAQYLATRGMVAASAEYRIKNRHQTTPVESFEDCRSAIRWVRGKAKDLGVDPKRVAGSGGSAGATCVAVAGLTQGGDAAGEDTKVSARPDVLVLYNPPMDFQAEAVRNLAAALPSDVRKRFDDVSPLLSAGKKIPPMIQFFGTDDALLAGARAFHEKAKAAGAESILFTAAGQKHGFFNDRPDNDWHEAVLVETDRFLAAHGYLKGEPLLQAPAGHPLQRQ